MRTKWRLFCEITFSTQTTIYFICRYLMETYSLTPNRISVFSFPYNPTATSRIKQVLSSQNIGYQEKLRILNTTVNVTFGCKVHNIIKLVLCKKFISQFTITDIAFDKLTTVMVNIPGNSSQITCISK